MAVENTNLERRVLAHQRILQALVGGTIEQASLKTGSASPVSEPTAPLADVELAAVVVRVAKRHGVWHLTRDAAFFGDYFGAEETFRAAATLTREIELGGRRVELALGEIAPGGSALQ